MFAKQYRWLICSGRYNVVQCDAKITASLAELEDAIISELEKLLADCSEETPVIEHIELGGDTVKVKWAV